MNIHTLEHTYTGTHLHDPTLSNTLQGTNVKCTVLVRTLVATNIIAIFLCSLVLYVYVKQWTATMELDTTVRCPSAYVYVHPHSYIDMICVDDNAVSSVF